MKNKIMLLLIIILSVFSLTACKSNQDALNFKNDYESMNGKTNTNGKEYRTVTIDASNPFIEISAKELIEKIDNEESFYVYFGSKLCPWCRSVIEKATEIANYNGVDKVYYVDIWSDNGEEILRDKYTLDDEGNTVKVSDGTDEYFTLLDYFDEVLPSYEYAANKNGGDILNIAEKRIYVPLFVYLAKGKPIRSTSGISDKQTSSREELTEEILKDEEELFDNFFISTCDESC